MKKYLIKLNGLPVNTVESKIVNGYELLVDPDEEQDFLVINPKVALELGSAGSLEFTLPPGSPMYDGYLGNGKEEEETEPKRWTMATVTLQEEGDYIFAGRVYSWKIDMFKRKTLCCEGALMFLHDSIQPYATYDGIYIDSFVSTLLTYHNMQVEDNRKIYPGHLNQLNGPSVYRVTSWETTFDALQKYVIDTNGGYFVVRTTEPSKGKYKHYLDYYTQTNILFSSNDYDEDAGTGYHQNLYNDQVIEFGENLLDISEAFAMDDVVTQVIPLGATIMADQILKELGFSDEEDNARTVVATTCRKDAGNDYQPVNNYAGIVSGKTVTVDNLKKDTNGAVWYHVKYKVKLTGFVFAGHTDKNDEWDALGEGSYGSAQVTVESTPVRMGAGDNFGVVTDYDSTDASDESQFTQGQTFSVKGVYMDVNGTGNKWFAVEFPEKNPSGYVPQEAIEPTNGYAPGATVIGGLSIVPIGSVRVKVQSVKIRSGPGKTHDFVTGAPKLQYGDEVEVCDIDYSDDDGIAWYYVKVKQLYYGFIRHNKLDVPENITSSCPNSILRQVGALGKDYITKKKETVGVPGFYTDQWSQSLSLTTDNRRTIAAVNKGYIVLTIADALAWEQSNVAETGEMLNGVPVFTGSQAIGADKVEPFDLGGFPIAKESLKMIRQVKKKKKDEKSIYINGGDNNAVERFGLITKVIEFSNCKTAKELMTKGSKYLLEHIRYPVEIACSSADLHYFNLNWAAFKIGQFVPVRFPGWRSEYSWGSSPYFTENGSLLRILKLEIELATGKKSIHIGTQKKKDLTEITKEVKDEAERDKNKIKVMNESDYDSLGYKDPDKIYFCAGG